MGRVKGANGRFVRAESDSEQPCEQRDHERDPHLPTTVPMPRAVQDITDGGMRAMWEMDGSGELQAPAAVVEPLD